MKFIKLTTLFFDIFCHFCFNGINGIPFVIFSINRQFIMKGFYFFCKVVYMCLRVWYYTIKSPYNPVSMFLHGC